MKRYGTENVLFHRNFSVSRRTINSHTAQVIIHSWALVLKCASICNILKIRLTHRAWWMFALTISKWPNGTCSLLDTWEIWQRQLELELATHGLSSALWPKPASHPWHGTIFPLLQHFLWKKHPVTILQGGQSRMKGFVGLPSVLQYLEFFYFWTWERE